MSDPFEFRQCITLVKATGRKAKTLAELRDLTAETSEASLYHHTYQYFLKAHALEYTNDFAQWAGESLEERALAEELSNVDPYSFNDINGLRIELMRVMHQYLERFPEPRDETGRRVFLQRDGYPGFSRRRLGKEPGRVSDRDQVCGQELPVLPFFRFPNPTGRQDE
jgi:hypothetical protein